MTDARRRETLIEQVVGAHRERDAATGEIRSSPAFHDLDASGRIEAFEATRVARAIERAASADGLTSTARAVLARIRRNAP